MTRTIAITALGLALASSVSAQPISGNVTFTSDYVFRGVSQTLEEPAIQGGIDYNNESGFYIGAWGSNVDFGGDAQVEFNGYLGFTREQQNGLSWDVGLLHYNYPGADGLNFEEVYFGLGYKGFGLKLSVTDNFAGTDGDGQYLEASYDLDFGNGFGLGLHVGQSTFDDIVGIEDYIDYKVSVSKSINVLDLEVAYVDTDENQFGNLDDERVVFSVSVSP